MADMGSMLKWTVPACLLWIAFDVGRGALHGIGEARQQQLEAVPVTELLADAAESLRQQAGQPWTKHAVLRSISQRGETMTISIELTDSAIKSISNRGFANRVVGMKHDIRREACQELRYVLGRGAHVEFENSGEALTEYPASELFPVEADAKDC